jgi:hypothetical protein
MNDNPLDRIPAFDRVSIRAVLVHDGEDPNPALEKAGIIDAVALPVMFDDELESSSGLFGDGITDNLTAVLEFDEEEHEEAEFPSEPSVTASRKQPDDADTGRITTGRLPVAFGAQPLAPVRRIGS